MASVANAARVAGIDEVGTAPATGSEPIDGAHLLRGEWRTLGRFVLEGFGAGLVVSLVLALAVFIVTNPAMAATAASPPGALYLQATDGARTQTPLVFTDVTMSITGMIARVIVTQRFVNPTDEWGEGVYVFPLPEKAAVDHLRMKVGERDIEGRIEERGVARRTYDAAKDGGRKATLVEQERPNMFTTSVANIGPRDEIAVTIEYQETLRYDEGTFRLRLPLAITPRYIPGAQLASLGAGIDGSAPTQGISDADRIIRTVSDADRITPPVVPRSEGFVLPVRIEIELDAGFPLANLASTYHPVHIESKGGHRYHLALADGPVPAARDFELTFTPEVGAAPRLALFTQTMGGKAYALLMALPPVTASTDGSRPPREITYVVDTSGSMEGVSMTQAREALLLALDRLQPGDRFNVIEFNSGTRSLFAAPVPYDVETARRAQRFVSGLRARGGTEMLPALEIALAGERNASILRQVVFLTDGAVGNEDAILDLVSKRLGDRRLFTVGIGPAPNMFFMTKAAQFGRGTYTAIGDVREVKEKMTALFRKLDNPALTDIEVAWPAGADVWPRVVPDLYAGEPVVVTAQFNAAALGGASGGTGESAGGGIRGDIGASTSDVTDRGARSGNVAVRGRRGDSTWGVLVPTADTGAAAGIGTLWARAKIDALMDAGRRGSPEQDIRAAVLDVALTHHLVSRYTSLVAVDVTPVRAPGAGLRKDAVPGNVPDGLTGFDALPQTATPAALLLLTGALTLLLAAGLGWRLRSLPTTTA